MGVSKTGIGVPPAGMIALADGSTVSATGKTPAAAKPEATATATQAVPAAATQATPATEAQTTPAPVKTEYNCISAASFTRRELLWMDSYRASHHILICPETPASNIPAATAPAQTDTPSSNGQGSHPEK